MLCIRGGVGVCVRCEAWEGSAPGPTPPPVARQTHHMPEDVWLLILGHYQGEQRVGTLKVLRAIARVDKTAAALAKSSMEQCKHFQNLRAPSRTENLSSFLVEWSKLTTPSGFRLTVRKPKCNLFNKSSTHLAINSKQLGSLTFV